MLSAHLQFFTTMWRTTQLVFDPNARLAVMQFNYNLSTRRALDQRPRPLREFSVGDEVAVWSRGTGKGAPGKQRRAQWRGPGIILGAVRGNFFVAMPGSGTIETQNS